MNTWLLPKYKPIIRLLSIVVAIAFFLSTSNIVLAKPTKNIPKEPEIKRSLFDKDSTPGDLSHVRSTARISEKAPLSFDIKKLELPKAIGRITSRHSGTSDKSIIYIQDLHAHYDAQKKLVEILDHLIGMYGIDVILVEAGVTDNDFSYIRNNHPKKVREEKAGELLKDGVINGEEYIDIAGDYELKFQGIEDKDLYERNMEAFLKVEAFRNEAIRAIKQLYRIAKDLKPHIYDKHLKEFDSLKNGYAGGKIKLNKYVGYLKSTSEKLKLNYKRWPNIALLVTTISIESKIDFDKVESERSALIESLTRSLAKGDVNKLIQASLDYKQEKIKQPEFYKALSLLCKKSKKTKLEDFKNLKLYVAYISKYNKIDPASLFKEISELEDGLQAKLCKSDEQRTLAGISKNLALLEAFLELKLSPRDWRYYKEHRAEFDIREWKKFLELNARRFKLSSRISGDISVITGNFDTLEEFYTAVVERDQAFLRNSVAKLDKEGADTAILIAGGFHAGHFTELLKEEGLSYAVVIPKISGSLGMDEEKYHSVLKESYSSRLWNTNLRETRSSENGTDLARIHEVFGTISFNRMIELMEQWGIAEEHINEVEQILTEQGIHHFTAVVKVLEGIQYSDKLRLAIHNCIWDPIVAKAFPGGRADPNKVIDITKENLSKNENVAKIVKLIENLIGRLDRQGRGNAAAYLREMLKRGTFKILNAHKLIPQDGEIDDWLVPFLAHSGGRGVWLWDIMVPRDNTELMRGDRYNESVILEELGAQLGVAHTINHSLRRKFNKGRQQGRGDAVLGESAFDVLEVKAGQKIAKGDFKAVRGTGKVDLNQTGPQGGESFSPKIIELASNVLITFKGDLSKYRPEEFPNHTRIQAILRCAREIEDTTQAFVAEFGRDAMYVRNRVFQLDGILRAAMRQFLMKRGISLTDPMAKAVALRAKQIVESGQIAAKAQPLSAEMDSDSMGFEAGAAHEGTFADKKIDRRQLLGMVRNDVPALLVTRRGFTDYVVSINSEFFEPTIGPETLRIYQQRLQELVNKSGLLGGELSKPANAHLLDYFAVSDFQREMAHRVHENGGQKSRQFIDNYVHSALRGERNTAYRRFKLDGLRREKPEAKQVLIADLMRSSVPRTVLASEATTEDWTNPDVMVVDDVYYNLGEEGRTNPLKPEETYRGEKIIIARWKGQTFMCYTSRTHTQRGVEIHQWRSCDFVPMGIWFQKQAPENMDDIPGGLNITLDELLYSGKMTEVDRGVFKQRVGHINSALLRDGKYEWSTAPKVVSSKAATAPGVREGVVVVRNDGTVLRIGSIRRGTAYVRAATREEKPLSELPNHKRVGDYTIKMGPKGAEYGIRLVQIRRTRKGRIGILEYTRDEEIKVTELMSDIEAGRARIATDTDLGMTEDGGEEGAERSDDRRHDRPVRRDRPVLLAESEIVQVPRTSVASHLESLDEHGDGDLLRRLIATAQEDNDVYLLEAPVPIIDMGLLPSSLNFNIGELAYRTKEVLDNAGLPVGQRRALADNYADVLSSLRALAMLHSDPEQLDRIGNFTFSDNDQLIDFNNFTLPDWAQGVEFTVAEMRILLYLTRTDPLVLKIPSSKIQEELTQEDISHMFGSMNRTDRISLKIILCSLRPIINEYLHPPNTDGNLRQMDAFECTPEMALAMNGHIERRRQQFYSAIDSLFAKIAVYAPNIDISTEVEAEKYIDEIERGLSGTRIIRQEGRGVSVDLQLDFSEGDRNIIKIGRLGFELKHEEKTVNIVYFNDEGEVGSTLELSDHEVSANLYDVLSNMALDFPSDLQIGLRDSELSYHAVFNQDHSLAPEIVYVLGQDREGDMLFLCERINGERSEPRMGVSAKDTPEEFQHHKDGLMNTVRFAITAARMLRANLSGEDLSAEQAYPGETEEVFFAKLESPNQFFEGETDLGMATDGGEKDAKLEKEIYTIGHDLPNRVLEAACEHLTRQNIMDFRNSLHNLRANIRASLRRSSATHLMGEVMPEEALVRNKGVAELRSQDYEQADELLIRVAWAMVEGIKGNTGVTENTRKAFERLKEAKRVGCRITHRDLSSALGTGGLKIAGRPAATGDMEATGATQIDLSVDYSDGDKGILKIGQLNFKFTDAENSIAILSPEGDELLRIAGDASYEALSNIAKSACEVLTVILRPGMVLYAYADGNNGKREEFIYLTNENICMYFIDDVEIDRWSERRKGFRNNIVTMARLAVMTARAVERDESPQKSDAPSVEEFLAKLSNPKQFFESETDLGMATDGGEEGSVSETLPRVVAHGDIHGELDGFIENLRQAGIIDEYDNWRGGEEEETDEEGNVLVQGGDVIDRGPKSREAMEFLRKLQRQAREAKRRKGEGARDEVVRIAGNHELMLLEGDFRYANFSDPQGLADEIREEILSGDIEAAHVIGDRLVVHGGLRSKIREMLKAEIAREKGIPIDEITEQDIADRINEVFVEAVRNNDYTHPIFWVDAARGGHDEVAGIFWCDFEDLAVSVNANEVKQWVAHTPEIRLGSIDPFTNSLGRLDMDAGLHEGYGGVHAFYVVENNQLKRVEKGADGEWGERVLGKFREDDAPAADAQVEVDLDVFAQELVNRFGQKAIQVSNRAFRSPKLEAFLAERGITSGDDPRVGQIAEKAEDILRQRADIAKPVTVAAVGAAVNTDERIIAYDMQLLVDRRLWRNAQGLTMVPGIQEYALAVQVVQDRHGNIVVGKTSPDTAFGEQKITLKHALDEKMAIDGDAHPNLREAVKRHNDKIDRVSREVDLGMSAEGGEEDKAVTITSPAAARERMQNINRDHLARIEALMANIEEGRQVIIPEELMPEGAEREKLIAKIRARGARDIAILPMDDVISKARNRTKGPNRVVLLSPELVDYWKTKDANWDRNCKAQTITLENYDLLHLEGAVALGRAVLAEDVQSVQHFYNLLTGGQLADMDAVMRAVANRELRLSVILPAIEIPEAEEYHQLRREAFQFLTSA